MMLRDRRLGSMRRTHSVLALDLYGVRQSADTAGAGDALHCRRRSLAVAPGPAAGPSHRRLFAARVQALEAAGAVLYGGS